jgi:two-component system, OmpR family, response regulator QseB
MLLVEDDLQLGAALNRALALAGFDSVWVRRLKEVQCSLAARPADALILDINLPDGEGFSLLANLREAGNPMPIIIMTARDGLDDRLRGLNGGADDYITKPFAVPELIARIHAITRRNAGHASPQWQIGALTIDVANQTASIAEERLDLTPTEFRLLTRLARQPGRVVSRMELTASVWVSGEDASPAALDFQIHGLRRKLGSARITTRRGLGFRLEAI